MAARASAPPKHEVMDSPKIPLDTPDGIRVRTAERFAVHVPVRLKPEGSRVITVCVGDVSTTGLMAHIDEPIALGCTVCIAMPGMGDVEARVRWTVGARVGVRFAEPIDVDRCRAEMMRLAEAA